MWTRKKMGIWDTEMLLEFVPRSKKNKFLRVQVCFFSNFDQNRNFFFYRCQYLHLGYARVSASKSIQSQLIGTER